MALRRGGDARVIGKATMRDDGGAARSAALGELESGEEHGMSCSCTPYIAATRVVCRYVHGERQTTMPHHVNASQLPTVLAFSRACPRFETSVGCTQNMPWRVGSESGTTH